MEKPYLIEGGIFKDERGVIAHVNAFDFSSVKRFYTIENTSLKTVRAWQGHIEERKYFYAIKGKFYIAYVKIDNWENPSKDLKAECKILSDLKSEILYIPAGYANGIKALEENSKLLVFSTLSIEEAVKEKIRYDKNLWVNWETL